MARGLLLLLIETLVTGSAFGQAAEVLGESPLPEGTSAAYWSIPLLADPRFVVIKAIPHDLDGDGYEDVVVLMRRDSPMTARVYFVPGTPQGLDPAAIRLLREQPLIAYNLFVGDWDGDAQPDLICVDYCPGPTCFYSEARIWIVERSTLEIEERYLFALPECGINTCDVFDVADFDLDRRADLLLGAGGSNAVKIGWSNATGGITYSFVSPYGLFNVWPTVRLDHDQDGYEDVMVGRAPTVPVPAVFVNQGDRTFAPVETGIPEDPSFSGLLPLWLNDDIFPDLLVTFEHSRQFYLRNDVAGTYTALPYDFLAGGQVWPAHLNGDGFVDFVEAPFGPPRLRYWLNEGQETFATREVRFPVDLGGGIGNLFALDADGDGDRDMVFAVAGTGRGRSALHIVETEQGPPPGVPALPSEVAAVGGPGSVAVTWSGSTSPWALPGHMAYGLVVASETDTLVVGDVVPHTGTARWVMDPGGLHATSLTLRSLAPGAYTVQVAAIDPVGQSSGLTPPVPFEVLPTHADEAPWSNADGLAPVFPNPARDAAALTLTLGRPRAAVEVAVYDVLGRRVALLHEGPLGTGTHRLSLSSRRLPSGVYVVRVSGEGLALTQALTVVR